MDNLYDSFFLPEEYSIDAGLKEAKAGENCKKIHKETNGNMDEVIKAFRKTFGL